MFKKLLVVLVALCMVSSFALAADRGFPSRGDVRLLSTGLAEGHTHVLTSPCLVYKIQMRIQEDDSWVALIDSNTTYAYDTVPDYMATINNLGNSRVKADIGDSTAGDWVNAEFDIPLYFEMGIFVETGLTEIATGVNDQQVGYDPDVIIHYTSVE